MRNCEKCGAEIMPMSGGKPRLSKIEGGDLGLGSGPVINFCQKCWIADQKKEKE